MILNIIRRITQCFNNKEEDYSFTLSHGLITIFLVIEERIKPFDQRFLKNPEVNGDTLSENDDEERLKIYIKEVFSSKVREDEKIGKEIKNILLSDIGRVDKISDCEKYIRSLYDIKEYIAKNNKDVDLQQIFLFFLDVSIEAFGVHIKALNEIRPRQNENVSTKRKPRPSAPVINNDNNQINRNISKPATVVNPVKNKLNTILNWIKQNPWTSCAILLSVIASVTIIILSSGSGLLIPVLIGLNLLGVSNFLVGSALGVTIGVGLAAFFRLAAEVYFKIYSFRRSDRLEQQTELSPSVIASVSRLKGSENNDQSAVLPKCFHPVLPRGSRVVDNKQCNHEQKELASSLPGLAT